MNIKRRDFLITGLQLSALMAAGEALPWMLAAADKKKNPVRFLVGYHKDKYVSDQMSRTAENIPGEIRILDPLTRKLASISTPIFPHGFCKSSTEPDLVVAVEKWTNLAVVTDVSKLEVVATLRAPKDVRFFGHAAFDSTGKFLYISGGQGEQAESVIVEFERKSWKVSRIIEVGGAGPHEVTLDPSGKFLVLAMSVPLKKIPNDLSGETILVSLPEGKIAHRFKTCSGRHQLWIDKKNVVISGLRIFKDGSAATHLGILNIESGEAKDFREGTGMPANIFGEALSLARYSPRQVLVTIPDAKYLLIWDFQANHTIPIKLEEGLSGVTALSNVFYFNAHSNSELHTGTVKLDSQFQEQKGSAPLVFGNGSHIYAYSR